MLWALTLLRSRRLMRGETPSLCARSEERSRGGGRRARPHVAMDLLAVDAGQVSEERRD